MPQFLLKLSLKTFGAVLFLVALFNGQAFATHKAPIVCPTPSKGYPLWDGVDPGYRTHKGQDIGMPKNTPLYAVSDGTVTPDNSDLDGWGVMARLSTDGHVHHYAHLNSVAKTGAVRAGDLIAYSGDSGNARGTPHLHWEVWTPSFPSGSYKNPAPIAFWNACTPVSSQPTTAIIAGRLTNATTGSGIGYHVIDLCNGRAVSTNKQGYWLAVLPLNAGFCVRHAKPPLGPPIDPSYHGPFTNVNQCCSYESQVATQNNTGYTLRYHSPTASQIRIETNGTGYLLDSFGKVWTLGTTTPKPFGAPGSSPAWPGWHIAKALQIHPGRLGGYVLDGLGAVHRFALGTNVPPAVSGFPSFAGDIARDLVIRDWATGSGYVLDGHGGIHSFNTAPTLTNRTPTPGKDINRRLILRPQAADPTKLSSNGYVLDYYGVLHPVGNQPGANAPSRWNTSVARAAVLNPSNTGGYVLDMSGCLHPFAVAFNPLPGPVNTGVCLPGANFAVDVIITSWSPVSGYVLNFKGGISRFGSAPAVGSGGPFWP